MKILPIIPLILCFATFAVAEDAPVLTPITQAAPDAPQVVEIEGDIEPLSDEEFTALQEAAATNDPARVNAVTAAIQDKHSRDERHKRHQAEQERKRLEKEKREEEERLHPKPRPVASWFGWAASCAFGAIWWPWSVALMLLKWGGYLLLLTVGLLFLSLLVGFIWVFWLVGSWLFRLIFGRRSNGGQGTVPPPGEVKPPAPHAPPYKTHRHYSEWDDE